MTLPPPQVVNIRRGADYDQYIGLGTPWGNPFANTCSRASAIRTYEKRIRGFLKDPGWRVDLKALSGKKLGCHCAPLPCHGDVLVKLFLELWGPDAKIDSGDLMRWEPQSGGWVLRVSFTDPVLGHRFAGLAYPLSNGRWIGEVFEKDLAGEFENLEKAKKWVEENL